MASANSQQGTSDSKPPTIICVFCGSSPGTSPAHLAAARALAESFHRHNIKLVYGGGSVGLMGELARTLVSLAGPDSVHGIIPKALMKYERAGRPVGYSTAAAQASDEKEPVAEGREINRKSADEDSTVAEGKTVMLQFPGSDLCAPMTVVNTMHERKNLMVKEVEKGGPGSGFVALSGGYGTLEELTEVTTWNQLGIHHRGICLYSVEGFWDGLVQWIRMAVEAGFISKGNEEIVQMRDTADGCVEALRNYEVAENRFNLDWDKK